MMLVSIFNRLDFLTSWCYATAVDVVAGAKVCLKEELKRVPFLGNVWDAMGFIFLARDWNKDKSHLDKACSVLNSYPCPYMVLIFCEGTRFTETKLKSSNEFAIKQGYKELKHHLTPRTRGFLHLFHSLKPSLSGILDSTVRFEGAKPSAMNLVLGKEMTVHCHTRRFELAAMPEEDEKLSAWLRHLYEEKDAAVDTFLKTGLFPAPKHYLTAPLRTLILSLVFLCFFTFPLLYIIVNVILGLPTVALYASFVILIIVICLLAYKLWGYTRLSKASDYGLKPSASSKQSKSD